MNQQYLDILEDSLVKKNHILDEIKRINDEQKECLQKEDIQFEDFDEYIEKKAEYIEELEKLDEGFETLYARVEDELKDNREQYADQIRNMQQLIREITDKSATIQAQESRNREYINNYFGKRRSEIREGRRNSKAAMNYYKVQSNTTYTEATFMDSKK